MNVVIVFKYRDEDCSFMSFLSYLQSINNGNVRSSMFRVTTLCQSWFLHIMLFLFTLNVETLRTRALSLALLCVSTIKFQLLTKYGVRTAKGVQDSESGRFAYYLIGSQCSPPNPFAFEGSHESTFQDLQAHLNSNPSTSARLVRDPSTPRLRLVRHEASLRGPLVWQDAV